MKPRDTPRTEDTVALLHCGGVTAEAAFERWIAFARELERENNRLTEERDRLKKDHEDDASELCQIEDALGFRDQFVATGKDGKLIGVHQAALEKIRDMVAALGEMEDSRDQLREELTKHEARLKWLHDCSTGQTDPEGYEWGIYRVKWEKGYAVAVLQTNSDLSDLDAEMARELNTP